MKHHVIVERRKVVAGDDRAVFQRAEVFFPLHAVDDEHVFFDEVEEIFIPDRVRDLSGYFTRQLFTKIST